MSLSPPMANGQCQGVEEHQVMQVALMTRLDEGLQANHVVLGGQLQGTVYLAPVVGVVSIREQEIVCPQVPDLVRGRGALTSKCSSANVQ